MQDWGREHDKLKERILERQAREALPFEDLSEEAIAGRKAVPFLDWCRLYLPHYFDVNFAPFHRRMHEAAGEAGMPTFVAAFRGAGKSVLLSLARPLYRCLAREVPYFIFGSQVQTLAAQILDYIRLEIEHNPRIRCDYGELATDGFAEEWTVDLGRLRDEHGRWALQEVKFEAFGIRMSPRGRRFRQYRPLEFLGDDLETAELARNPHREQQLWDWMMDEVVPAMEPEQYVFTVVGTMFGPGCMMERAKELAVKAGQSGRPLARAFVQEATERGQSVWPERFSDEALARIRATIGLRNWMRNYDLSAEDPTKPFQARWFTEYARGRVHMDKLDVVCFLDPAISEKDTSCPRALVVVGCDRVSGMRYVLEAWIERGTPHEMVERIFDFYGRFKPRVIGIEINGGFALIKPLLEERMRQRGWVPTRYIKNETPKEIRIESLAPAMEAGRWRWPMEPSPGVRVLQDQFLNYPDGFVDGPDACAGCDEMLPDSFAPTARTFGYRRLERRTDFAAVA